MMFFGAYLLYFIYIFEEKPPTAEVVPQVWEGRYGDAKQLKCITSGVPTPIVTWEGPFGALPKNVTITDDNLDFSFATLSHNGVYTCKATNILGQAEDVGHVIIEPIINMKTTPAGPVLNIPAGEPLNIRCEAFGDPAPSVKWLHDPGPERGDLPDDYVPVGMDGMEITHPRVGIRNSGEYICQGSSSYGIVSKKIKVNVVDLTPTATVAILGGNIRRFSPGKPAELVCVTSAPILVERLEWIKQDSSSKVDNPEDNGRLQFRSFTANDIGKYACRAYVNGKIFATSEVVVTTVNSAPLKAAFVSIEGPKIHAIEEGDRLPLRCSIEGDGGNVRYVWATMREGRVLKNLPASSSIQISANSVSDYAIYRCEVFKDNDLMGTAYTAVTVGQKWKSAYFEQQFDAESEAHLQCPVFLVPGSMVTWSRENNAPLRDVPKPFQKELIIKKFDVNDAGKYTCEVIIDSKRLWGHVDARVYEPSVVKLKIEGALGKIHVGRAASLRCSVQGRENVPVTWTKVDKDMPDNAQVNGGTLSFSSVQEDDGGLYECSAVPEANLPPLRMKKFLHIERTKRKRKHILNKFLHKKHKLENKPKGMFAQWESNI